MAITGGQVKYGKCQVEIILQQLETNSWVFTQLYG